MNQKFGIYVHIPYCLQRCSYCDFTTFEQSQMPDPELYINTLIKEIHMRHNLFSKTVPLTSIYFGGGTPSLIAPHLLKKVINSIYSVGFRTDLETEITLEINPATLTSAHLDYYLEVGFNRFSLGVQTFSNEKLKFLNRKHSSQDTCETLDILKGKKHQLSGEKLNLSVDLLYSLPHQTIDELKSDLSRLLSFQPQHVSPYCLTLKDRHPLLPLLPSEEIQIEMFELVDLALKKAGYVQYEISNYCLPNYHSRHNELYWSDQSYWGLGLSAHSYQNANLLPLWGRRFWNSSHLDEYFALKDPQDEILTLEQSLTDYCHTFLRRSKGINHKMFIQKYSSNNWEKVSPILKKLVNETYLVNECSDWFLSPKGRLSSNYVFSLLTFTK